eukprot:425198-Prymnesium_polylepis.1
MGDVRIKLGSQLRVHVRKRRSAASVRLLHGCVAQPDQERPILRAHRPNGDTLLHEHPQPFEARGCIGAICGALKDCGWRSLNHQLGRPHDLVQIRHHEHELRAARPQLALAKLTQPHRATGGMALIGALRSHFPLVRRVLGQAATAVVARLVSHVKLERACATATHERKQDFVAHQELLSMHVVLALPAEAVCIARNVVGLAVEEEPRDDGHLRFASTLPSAFCWACEALPARCDRLTEAQKHIRLPLVGVVESLAELLQVAEQRATFGRQVDQALDVRLVCLWAATARRISVPKIEGLSAPARRVPLRWRAWTLRALAVHLCFGRLLCGGRALPLCRGLLSCLFSCLLCCGLLCELRRWNAVPSAHGRCW